MLFYALLRRKLPLYLYITAFVYLPPIAQYSISSAMKTDISNIEHIWPTAWMKNMLNNWKMFVNVNKELGGTNLSRFY